MDESDDTEPTADATRVATFSIDVTFSPRTIDPDAISQRLGLAPTWMWRAGERVRNPNGSVRPHPARESRWTLALAYFDRREDELDIWNETDEDLGPRLNERLAAFLEPFLRESSFVREVVTDSTRAQIVLNFPGQFHFGFLVEPVTLSAIAGLNLELGIEIFPDSAGPHVEGDRTAGGPLRIVGNQGSSDA
ncbi:MAG: DUF4279 domain-containing protein [Candidatus Eremiobacteraeota bacterium]|nr:DUF4279 domain-containing protein [Candidatus Eremiobacteraeota bacterium]